VFSIRSSGIFLFSQKCVVSAEFENSARKFLAEFVNDSEKSQVPLTTGLTAQEEFCIRQTAEQLGLIIRSQGRKGEKLLYIAKPEPE
jgi:phenylacetate-coenzyme A ligase PaaK-like adenylate-forming protein